MERIFLKKARAWKEVRAGRRHMRAVPRRAAARRPAAFGRGLVSIERDTIDDVRGFGQPLATRRPRTGARCTSRAHGSLPPTAITCPVAGARAGTCRAAPRAPAHVITSWGHGHVRALLGPFSLSRGRAALPQAPSRIRSQRREEAPRRHGDQSGSATHNNALDVHASPIGLLMPFSSPAKGDSNK